MSSSAANGNSQSISVLSNPRLFAQNPVSLLGSIVSQGAKSSGGQISSNLPTSKSGKGLSMSATMDTLLGHLTSGISSQATSAKSTTGKAGVGSGRMKKAPTSKLDGSAIGTKSTVHNAKPSGTKLSTANTGLKAGVPQSIQVMGSVDDLSNLNLLSSLVAAVAATQATSSSLQSTSSPEPTLTSSLKTSVGHPSNFHSTSKTDMKRPLESIVSALASVSRHSNASPLTENASLYVSSQGHTPSSTPPEDGAASTDSKQQECDREVDKLIAASSSIKRVPSGGGSVYGGVSTTGAGGELPRSVVRTGLGTMATSESSESQTNSSAHSENSDMTTSLASIIPSYSPSMSSQSSLLLYTRSLSFPLSVSAETTTDEEDHLESATRGISELSKLLGTDNSTDTNSGANARNDCSVYKANWNPSNLLSNSASNKNAEFGPDKSGKPYLSSLLESQIHGTVLHKSLAPSTLNSSGANSSRSESIENTVDIDPSR